ncbi:MAG: serine/threonine protein kinase [Sandaracinaceae bacterium]
MHDHRAPLTHIGGYPIERAIASGGMATVYLARAKSEEGARYVALKRLHPHLAADPDHVAMFFDEARLASQLHHPNICQVIDHGSDGDDHYMVMEYVHGTTLADLLLAAARERATLDMQAWYGAVCRIVAEACDAIDAAHRIVGADGRPLLVVHRDVSPQNLMISTDGVTKVMDFGIAKYVARESRTSTGAVKGKFTYMAPEQIHDAPNVDHRVDVWALGVVLWEALVLKRLFRRANEATTIHAVMQAPILAPSSVATDVPRALDPVVMRALSRDADARYATTLALARALRSVAPEASREDVARIVSSLRPTPTLEALTADEREHTSATPPPEAPTRIDWLVSDDSSPARPVPGGRRGVAIVAALAFVVGVSALIWAYLPHDRPAATDGETPAPAIDRPAASVSDAPVVPARPATSDGDHPADDPAGPASDPPRDTARNIAASAEPSGRARPRHDVDLPAEAPPADTASPERGRIFVTQPGSWANVYVDDRFVDATPVRLDVEAGRHRIELRVEGQPPGCRFEVDVAAGATTSVRGCP